MTLVLVPRDDRLLSNLLNEAVAKAAPRVHFIAYTMIKSTGTSRSTDILPMRDT